MVHPLPSKGCAPSPNSGIPLPLCALKARLHDDGDMRQLHAIAAGLLPPEEVALLASEPTPLRLLLLRLRAIAGGLRNRGEMGMDAFRFAAWSKWPSWRGHAGHHGLLGLHLKA